MINGRALVEFVGVQCKLILASYSTHSMLQNCLQSSCSCTGWPLWMVKTSCLLRFGEIRKLVMDTYCSDMIAEHPIFKSIRGFKRPDGSPCTAPQEGTHCYQNMCNLAHPNLSRQHFLWELNSNSQDNVWDIAACKPEYDDDVAEGERVLVLEDVVEDDPDDAEDGDEEVGAVPLRLQVPVRRERDHLHYHLKIENNVKVTHYKALYSSGSFWFCGERLQLFNCTK